MNIFKDVISIAAGSSQTWIIDRFQEEDWVSKLTMELYSTQGGNITIDETDLLNEATPTFNTLVNNASLTSNTLYESAQLTLTKRYTRIVVSNTGSVAATVLIRPKTE